MKFKRAFSLIELLVTIAIIAILAGIMLPALNAARGKAQSAYCQNNLRQLGVALKNYLDNSQAERIPLISSMPSIDADSPRLCDILADEAGSAKLFRCPADIGPAASRLSEYTDEFDELKYDTTKLEKASSKTDFETEGSSYEFNTHLCGRKPSDRTRSMLMHDYRPYHGKAGTYGAANYLFGDGHVGDIKRR